MTVQKFEEQLTAFDGESLNVYRWIPETPRAAILISHGWSEHAGRYRELAEWLAEQDYEVHALDHRGHGKSSGKRGHVNDWRDFARDLEQVRESIDQSRQFLLGHSMGGMISCLHLLEFPQRFSAVALSGPSLDLSYKVPKIKELLSKALSRWLPSLSLSGDIDPSIVCGNPAVVEAYRNDPFNHGKISARWFIGFQEAIQRLKQQAHTIATPIAIWHGAGDELVAPWVSEQFYQALTVEPRHYELVPDTLHEILYEENWQQTAAAMLAWFERA